MSTVHRPSGECDYEEERRGRPTGAFTLVELLVVIAVAGTLAALSIPAIKKFGQSNQQVAATRQVLDDVGRARQLAIANRTTVYMVFLPNFYLKQGNFAYLPPDTRAQALRLASGQGRSYALLSLRTIGDQPGQFNPQYLSDWKELPRGWIFAQDKFFGNTPWVTYTNFGTFPDWTVSRFEWSATGLDPSKLRFPFPTADAPLGYVSLPYIAFNHNGGLTSARDHGGELIPLARGVVDPAVDAGSGDLLTDVASIQESPVGNSQGVPNLIFIDGLTGRARLEQRQIE